MSTVKISQLTQGSITTNKANTIFVGVNLEVGSTNSYTLEQIFGLSDAYAQAAFLKANTPSSVANSAGNFANGAFLTANSGATFANASFITANASYLSQNTTASFANGAFLTANASYDSQNTTATFANAAFTRANSGYGQANSAASFANGAFTKANNTLSLTGGIIAGNVTANSFIANTSVYSPIYYSSGGTTNLTLSDIGIAAINSGGQETKFGASGIESIGVYSGSFGGNKISLNNETNIISNRYDVVKIQTGTTGTVANEWSFSNNQIIFPDSTYQNTAFQGVAIDQTSRNTANSGASFANGAFLTANSGALFANGAFTKANNALANASGTLAGSLVITGYVEPKNGFVYTPTVFAGVQTAITIDMATQSMVRAQTATGLVVTLASLSIGKEVVVWITNTAATSQVFTHGVSAINSTINATTYTIPATSTILARYMCVDGTTQNTFVAITRA